MSWKRAASVSVGIARRNLATALRTPSLAVPPLMVPLFTLVATAGGLSAVRAVPRFDFDGNYTAFMFVFVLLQSSTMSGQFAALSLARDFETGFARRLMLAAPSRWQIVTGYGLAGLVRTLVTIPILFAIGLLGGMEVNGNVGQLLGLAGLALVLAVITSLWSMGLALRMRTTQAAPLMMLPIFAALFSSPAFVPLDALSGWLHGVASLNPLTPMVDAGRGLLSGHPTSIALAWVAAGGMLAVLTVWSLTGVRRAEAAGGGT